jgi:transcriptional repressor NrdR
VVKKDGRREEFSHQKLHQKLRVALTKRPVSEAAVEALIGRVEAALLATGAAEVPSAMIGDLVLRELKQLDDVAYIRFASVYRSFSDLEALKREVDDLIDQRDGSHMLPKVARRRQRIRTPKHGRRLVHPLVTAE